MEYSKINALTKFGPDDYDLWTLTLPREKIHEIRQTPVTIDGDVRKIFTELPTQKSEGNINFVLPHSKGLQLYAVDMGEDFTDRNRYNGTSVRGSREEIMAELRESMKAMGYSLHGNAAFCDVDILATLQTIMEHNTDFYQTDFQYDKDSLREAAEDRNGARQFFWMSRKSGTWCVKERDVYIRNTSSHNTWNYYGGSRDERPKAFWINIHGVDNDKRIMGDVLEMDYQKHLDYLCTNSLDPVAIEVVFKSPNDVRAFDYQEYQQNWQSIGQRYGTPERSQFMVSDSHELARVAIEARHQFWDATETMTVEDYVKRLEHDRLHDYGYTADDVLRIGPLDADVAVKHGLCCYALQKDGTKEPIADKDACQHHLYHDGMYGMTTAEQQLLQYFKQDCKPLFSGEEMHELCTLAVQAGMNNDPTKAYLLDSIIHKLECAIPQSAQADAQEQEEEYSREE